MTKLLHIVPRLPSAIDGIGDFAAKLAEQMSSYSTEFIVCDPNWKNTESLTWNIEILSERTSEDLLSSLNRMNPETIVLHYVGYGYSKRGCPEWLVSALENWKRNHNDMPIITVFHELAASGPIWTSAFWLRKKQESLVKRVSAISSHSLTSISYFAEQLKALKSEVTKQAIFSVIGEPERLIRFEDREDRLVIFGSPASRKRVYESGSLLLLDLVESLEVKEILDIGSPMDWNPDEISGVKIIHKGILETVEISKALRHTKFGVVEYAPRFLGKSTIFASYCSHGVCPIVVGSGEIDEQADGLQPGVHFINSKDHLKSLNFSEVSKHAGDWYFEHPISKYTEILEEIISAEPRGRGLRVQ